jgi:hypothetical protein
MLPKTNGRKSDWMDRWIDGWGWLLDAIKMICLIKNNNRRSDWIERMASRCCWNDLVDQ